VRFFTNALKRSMRSAGRHAYEAEIALLEDVREEEISPAAPDFTDFTAGDGVFITPAPITAGEEVKVWYSGLLSRKNPDRIYLHYGIGPGPWQQVKDVLMEESSPGVYTCTIRAGDGGRLELCFHDGAGNWDNNNGRNWHYTIHNGLIQ